MPVMERSVGLDRSYHRLPVLFVDDFAVVTPELVRQVREGGRGREGGNEDIGRKREKRREERVDRGGKGREGREKMRWE
jgi:hypothetical protein